MTSKPEKIIKSEKEIKTTPQKVQLGYPSFFTIYREKFRGSHWRFEIDTESYFKYKALPREKYNGNYEHYWDFVTETEKNVGVIVDILGKEEIGSKWKKKPLETAQLLVDFVQSFPYQDREPCYAKYPLETLCENGGNCLDLSILGASMLLYAGIESCFLDFKEHVALGIAVPGKGKFVQVNGIKYYATEITSTEWPDHRYTDKIGVFNSVLLNKANVILMEKYRK